MPFAGDRRAGADRAASTSGRRSPTRQVSRTPSRSAPARSRSTTFAPTQYTLKKNATYWQADKIAPSEVEFPAQSSNQSTNQLDVTSGKFDWSYNYLPDVQADLRLKDPTHNIYWFPPGGTIGLFLNLTKAPYNNVDFRKGISLALNRKTIAHQGGQRLHRRGQPVRPDPAQPEEVARPEPAQPGQRHAGHSRPPRRRSPKAGYTMQGGKLVDARQAGLDDDRDAEQLHRLGRRGQGGRATQLTAVGIKVKLDLPQYAQYEKDIQRRHVRRGDGRLRRHRVTRTPTSTTR